MPWRVLPFSAAEFTPELFALCRDVPYLDHLLCWIEDAHVPVQRAERRLRNWQAEIAGGGSFGIRLPGTGAILRSGRAVMLADKTVCYGVQDRPDLMLAASRIGFGHPITSVLLPERRIAINVGGPHWTVDAAQAEQATALFASHALDFAAPPAASPPAPVLVTGDVNFAHHFWNQLGALEALLSRGQPVDAAVTHQPIAPLTDIFAGGPALRTRPITPRGLTQLDPWRVLPFPAGGTIVSATLRQRILQLAAQRPDDGSRAFVSGTRGLRRVWLTIRLRNRTALNLLDALSAIAESLLTDGGFAIVLDGFSRPNDYAANAGYNKPLIERTIALKQAFCQALCQDIARRAGAAALDRVHVSIGADLQDSIRLASACHAYFAHHGTVQHKIGYFTKVPGMVHSNPAILAGDHAGTQRYAAEDPGVVQYIGRHLTSDAPLPGGRAAQPDNNYRFNDIPALVSLFRRFVDSHALNPGN